MNQQEFDFLVQNHTQKLKSTKEKSIVKLVIQNKQMKDIHFGYDYFSRIIITNCVLIDCSLNDCYFSNSDFSNSKFVNCDFGYASFVKCNLTNSDFSNQNISMTDMQQSVIQNMNLFGCPDLELELLLDLTTGNPVFIKDH